MWSFLTNNGSDKIVYAMFTEVYDVHIQLAFKKILYMEFD